MEIVPGTTLNETMAVAANTAKKFLTGSFIVNFFLKTGLSELLGLIQNISIIVHLQLINVRTPANAQIFFSHLL